MNFGERAIFYCQVKEQKRIAEEESRIWLKAMMKAKAMMLQANDESEAASRILRQLERTA